MGKLDSKSNQDLKYHLKILQFEYDALKLEIEKKAYRMDEIETEFGKTLSELKKRLNL